MSWFNKVNSKGDVIGSIPHLQQLTLDGKIVTIDGVLPLKGYQPQWYVDDWFVFIGEDERSIWASNGRQLDHLYTGDIKRSTLVTDRWGNWATWGAGGSFVSTGTKMFHTLDRVVAIKKEKYWCLVSDRLVEKSVNDNVSTILDNNVAVCHNGEIWNTYLPDGPHVRPEQIGDYGLAHQVCSIEFPITQRWALVLQGGGESNKDNLVLYPYGSPMGYKLVSAGDVLYPHAEWMPEKSRIRVVANNSRGETLQWDVDILEPRVNITQGFVPDIPSQSPGVTVTKYDRLLTNANRWELQWHDRNNPGYEGRVEFINGSVHITYRTPEGSDRTGAIRKVVIQ